MLLSSFSIAVVVVLICCSHQSDLRFIIQVDLKLICKPLLLVVTKVTAHLLQKYVLLGMHI